MKVFALTFLAYARAADHVHSSGKKLREFATAVLKSANFPGCAGRNDNVARTQYGKSGY